MSDDRWPSEEPPPPDGLGGWGAAYDAWKTTDDREIDDPPARMCNCSGRLEYDKRAGRTICEHERKTLDRFEKAERISPYRTRSDGTQLCEICRAEIPAGEKCNPRIGRKGGWQFMCDGCSNDSQRQRHEKATTNPKEPW